MKKIILSLIAFIGLSFYSTCFVNAQGVGINPAGNNPDPSAMFDVSSTTKGTLITRMTTIQRNAIISPAQSLLIFNTTTNCFEFYANGTWQTLGCACTVPTAVTASASPTTLCAGSTLTLTGGATGATTWSWTGPNGYTSSLQSPTISNISTVGAGVYTLTASNTCGAAAAVNTTSVTINTVPSLPTATAGSGTTATTFTANWSASSGATTYYLDVSTVNTFASFVGIYNNFNAGNVLTSNVTGLTCNTTYYYQVRANNACGASANSNTIAVTTGACASLPTCGSQVWAAANLNAGTQIAPSTTQTTNQKYCYNDLAANCTIYGGIYQWSNVMLGGASVSCDPCGPSTGHGGAQGMCPSGFHIPSDLEWSRYEYCIENTIAPAGTTTLATFQNNTSWRGSTTAGVGPGAKMKVTSSNSPSWDGTNTSGFAALPAGEVFSGTSSYQGGETYFWAATQVNSSYAWSRGLYTGYVQTVRNSNGDKNWGFMVRCLKD